MTPELVRTAAAAAGRRPRAAARQQQVRVCVEHSCNASLLSHLTLYCSSSSKPIITSTGAPPSAAGSSRRRTQAPVGMMAASMPAGLRSTTSRSAMSAAARAVSAARAPSSSAKRAMPSCSAARLFPADRQTLGAALMNGRLQGREIAQGKRAKLQIQAVPLGGISAASICSFKALLPSGRCSSLFLPLQPPRGSYGSYHNLAAAAGELAWWVVPNPAPAPAVPLLHPCRLRFRLHLHVCAQFPCKA